MRNDAVSVERVAVPDVLYETNSVLVLFDIEVTNPMNGKAYNIKEKHLMRYFFQPEILYFLKKAGFKNISFYNWLSQKPLDQAPWYRCCVAS